MIIDKMENRSLYAKLGSNIGPALEYLRTTDFSRLENGRHEIDGEEMFLLLSDYETKDPAECKIEAHRKYADVQCMIKGTEQIGYAPFDGRPSITVYDENNDYILYEGRVSYIDFHEGMFAIFFPKDLHMPGVGEANSRVRKAVVKVKI
jgi:YhcH/YjgK/YiaL family protein